MKVNTDCASTVLPAKDKYLDFHPSDLPSICLKHFERGLHYMDMPRNEGVHKYFSSFVVLGILASSKIFFVVNFL